MKKQTEAQAKRFLADVEKLLKKHGSKVQAKDREKLEAAMEQVRQALGGGGEDGKRLSTALKELDARVDQVLGFAKKSSGREYAESIAIAILIALVLRAFVVEAFKIPTGSMIPTLEVGDHIFVNKFTYGLRVPFSNMWFAEWGEPERGDVIVFRFPLDISKDYIKRVVALPGDRIRVRDKEVFINGERLERSAPVAHRYVDEGEDSSDLFGLFGQDRGGGVRNALSFTEASAGGEQRYTVLYDAAPEYSRRTFPGGDGLPGLDCTAPRPAQPGECTVREGWVFVMGDNRDNSSDGRVWGGVPREYIKGKAMFIWWSRGPHTGVRWGRMGSPVH